eukprot:scaffold114344_cov66-Cyclotella_meneghiniana.AAC.1
MAVDAKAWISCSTNLQRGERASSRAPIRLLKPPLKSQQYELQNYNKINNRNSLRSLQNL